MLDKNMKSINLIVKSIQEIIFYCNVTFIQFKLCTYLILKDFQNLLELSSHE